MLAVDSERLGGSRAQSKPGCQRGTITGSMPPVRVLGDSDSPDSSRCVDMVYVAGGPRVGRPVGRPAGRRSEVGSSCVLCVRGTGDGSRPPFRGMIQCIEPSASSCPSWERGRPRWVRFPLEAVTQQTRGRRHRSAAFAGSISSGLDQQPPPSSPVRTFSQRLAGLLHPLMQISESSQSAERTGLSDRQVQALPPISIFATPW
jgi:hypothetical protein